LRTTLQARSAGPIAYRALNVKTAPVGEIAGTFSDSFYIRTFLDELVFVTSLPVKSPITVNLASAADFERLLELHGQVFLDETSLRVGATVTIDFHGASIQQPKPDLSSTQIEWLSEALYLATTILSIVDTHQSVLDHASIAYKGTRQFFQTGILSLRHAGESETFLKTAEEIVGLGSGFTPSGDDVLSGFLCAYNSLSQAVGYEKILMDFHSLKRNTHWISAKLLDYMQHGVCDDQVAQLVGSTNTDEFIVALESLLPRGHTSGIDVSTGCVLGLSLLADVANDRHGTETVIRRLGLS
jgi:hypothetical protein